MTRVLLLAFALLTSLTSTACQWGQRADRFSAATTPAGTDVRFRNDDRDSYQRAELYAVDSAGVYVFDGRLRYVAWTQLRALEVPRFGEAYRSYNGLVPSAGTQRRLALLSRFPQGLDGTLLANVLQLLNQQTVDRSP